jgi:hypothetical protein
MPCDSDSLCQEVMQLPGSDPTVLRPSLVPPSAPIEPFEIVTKGLMEENKPV